MKLDPTIFRYVTREEFRVLQAVEMGMRNHELVPVPLIETIAKVNRGCTYKILQTLLRHKLVGHEGKKYDGYRLTYFGYDFLALRALLARGTIVAVGRRLGVGKESDVHYCQGADGEVLALKLHRLGRVSFRAIKEKRDYLQHRQHASWMYMARLAAMKEFAYMKALKDEGFPVPTPVDQNRHCVIMSFIHAVPLFHLRTLRHPNQVLERLMRLLVRLARAGIVHGDFNEFNLMIDKDEKLTLIDFPQIIHLSHENAKDHFDRDVRSICEFFRKRINIDVEQWPKFDEVMAEVAASQEAPVLAKAPVVEGLGRREDAMLVAVHEEDRGRQEDGEGTESEGEEDGSSAEEDGATDQEAKENPEGFQPLHAPGERGPHAEEQEAEAEAADAPADALAGGGPPGGEESGGGQSGSDSDDSGSEASDGPGQVNVKSGRRTRHRQTAKEARKNLQRQQRQRPAKANNSKAKELRKAKHEIRDFMC
uniref:Serine/threonine-protein kinase RIO2 n=1 Tax=Alexandrium monilatum TaxID=311494 RepID=A0A7S4RMP4_9DINO